MPKQDGDQVKQNQRIRKIGLMAFAMIAVLPGCAPSPYDFPILTQTADGSRAYSMRGSFMTAREEYVREQVTQQMELMCGGPIEIVEMRILNADNAFGVPHRYYESLIRCK